MRYHARGFTNQPQEFQQGTRVIWMAVTDHHLIHSPGVYSQPREIVGQSHSCESGVQ